MLQHAIGREFFEGYEKQGLRIPPVKSEIELISYFGARTLAVTLNGDGMAATALATQQRELSQTLGIPVIRPLDEGLDPLVPVVRRFIAEQAGTPSTSR